MTSSADVRIAIPGRIMTALHTEPVMMRPLMVHVRALLVYHLPGCTASQRQVRDPHRQHLISNNSIQCGNFFALLTSVFVCVQIDVQIIGYPLPTVMKEMLFGKICLPGKWERKTNLLCLT